MKSVLSSIVAAIVAVSFAGIVSAAEPAAPAPAATPAADNAKPATPAKKKKAKKATDEAAPLSEDKVPLTKGEKAATPDKKKAKGEAAPLSEDKVPLTKGEKAAKPDKSALSGLSLFGREDKKEKGFKTGGEQRTYVVQPGDTLFRVAEKFYGDSTHWKRIRDANRTRIDPDGRMRAGQIITVP